MGREETTTRAEPKFELITPELQPAEPEFNGWPIDPRHPVNRKR